MDEEAKEVEIGRMSSQTNGYPRDFLQIFTEGNQNPKGFSEPQEENQEIELSLGLSLGGCFGVDPKESNNRLIRSSSTAGLTTLLKNDDFVSQQLVACPALIRTCSLPTETEEEWRKRKELQSLRRLEAKRKRSEKQRNFRAVNKYRATFEGNCEVDKPNEEEGSMGMMNLKVKVEGGGVRTGLTSYSVGDVPTQQQQSMVSIGFSPSVPLNFGLPAWAGIARGASTGRTMDGSLNGKSNILGLRGFLPSPPRSQGSSGVSEFETRPVQEARSPLSLLEQNEQKPAIATEISSTVTRVETQNPNEQKPAIATEISGTVTRVETQNPSKKPKVIGSGEPRETGTMVINDMPCVSTKGDGPNGRKIEGLLYKYRKGEEVRIVCVCHGSFLTPAEFVKHAGGGDVAHPLRHIVVSRPPPFL